MKDNNIIHRDLKPSNILLSLNKKRNKKRRISNEKEGKNSY